MTNRESAERETFALTSEARNKFEYIVVSMGTSAGNTKEPLFDDLASTLKQALPPLLAFLTILLSFTVNAAVKEDYYPVSLSPLKHNNSLN